MPKSLLPMKVVLARRETDYRRDPDSGGGVVTFEPVTPALRKRFSAEVSSVQKAFEPSFSQFPSLPAVARVDLKTAAAAKSHRPTLLFNADTCPIIGVDRPGELLVSVDAKGLDALRGVILTGNTQKQIANISTIEHITPFRTADVLEGQSVEQLAAASTRKSSPIRVRVFRHGRTLIDSAIDSQIQALAKENGVKRLEPVDYGDDVRVYAVSGASADAVRAIANFVGTQSVSLFPEFRIVRTAAHVVGAIDDRRFPAPEPGATYGLVGVIDSGTDPKNKRLQAYVERRENWVKTRQNNDHGSFVAGLIANARALNGGSNQFPSVRSRIVDIVAIDESGVLSEYDLVTVIDRAVREHKDVRVWNLSLGQSTPCNDGRFSLLACKLDSIARKRGVLFVIAAGNYESLPLRTWPPEDLNEDDRICPPADSVRGLTVGSLAHISNQSTCVGVDEPSGFSRRGPAPHFYIKPEVSHYGGNCDETGDCLQCGIVSTDGSGNLAENIGTSFAAPSVATIAANVFRELEPEGEVTPSFVRGMIAHSAFLRSGRPNAQDVRYRGFGSPGDIADIMNCNQSSATVIFHAELTDRHFFEKHDFPMPRCLNAPNKGLQAEVFMTLAYDPPTDARFGIEYCRTNITASLGTVAFNAKTGKEEYKPQLKPAPKDITKGCESKLVSEGFKWSPLKFYHRTFTAGPGNSRWRLHLEILNRDGYSCREPQKLVLFVTIRDPEGHAPVYDTLVSEMEKLSWGATDLRLASRVRTRRSRN